MALFVIMLSNFLHPAPSSPLPSTHLLRAILLRQVSVMMEFYQMNLLVVVQSKHSVVVAGNKRQFPNELFEK